ncbi:MAG: TatD family hydrolase [Candidatus Micrarchaeota archaeon]|nr:TatD family hydrolase [Candidatus Micrarchaeota archaeon]
MASYLFADAHCHLDSCPGEILPHILQITCGSSIDSCRKNSRIASEREGTYLTAGIAPQEAMQHKDIKVMLSEWEDEISKFPKLVAIGEIGLDFHWAKTEEERFLQHECFISQLVLAERLSLPVVIHSREAEAQCLEILRNFNLPFMLHCFSGTAEQALSAADVAGKGIISIPPILNSERRKFVRDLSLERLVAETDAPTIGKSPTDAMESIKIIAEIKGLEQEAVRQKTLENTMKFFRIQ